MTDINFKDAILYDAEAGHFISRDHQRIAEIIQDYNPDLYLCWIPPDKRSLDDTEPFAIIHMPDGKEQYIVRRCKDSEIDERLLAWLWSNDQARQGNDILNQIEAAEAAKKAIELKKQQEKLDDRKDFALNVLKSPLNWYRHGKTTYRG